MAKKKGEQSRGKQPGSKRNAKTQEDADPCAGLTCGSLWAMTLQNIVVVCAVFGAVLWLSLAQMGAQQRGLQEQQAAAAAALVAKGIGARIELLANNLKQQAAVVGAARQLSSGDEQAVKSSEEWLSRMLPGRPRVQILPPDVDRIEREAAKDFGFAKLEMLRAAVKNGDVPIEVHATGDDIREVMIVAPASDSDGRVVALLMAAFPADFLKTMVDELGAGYSLGLRQITDSGGWALHPASGQERLQGYQKVPGTIWEVGYAVVDGQTAGSQGVMVMAVIGGGLLLVILVLLIGLKQVKGKLAKDLAEFKSTINEMLGKGGTQTRKLRMRELQGLMDWFVKSAYSIPADVQTTRNSAKVPSKGSARTEEPPRDKAKGTAPPPPPSSLPTYEVEEEVAPEAEGQQPAVKLPATIISGSDIRGRRDGELGRETVFELGRAIGSESLQKHQDTIIVANDGRVGGQELVEALHRGLIASGCNLVDIGVATTPMLYFATHYLASNSGVMLTGSDSRHGEVALKVLINGKVLAGVALEKLRQRLLRGDLMEGEGEINAQELGADYFERIVDDVQVARSMHVVIDAGNGAAGPIAPELFRQLGCEVTELYCDLDGNFPNHPPEPGDPLNLTPLVDKVREVGADIGFAFDGDGDRLGIVDSSGHIIWPDRALILLARDVLARQPGADVVYDVKSTRNLATEILNAGGRPVMWKSGHALIAEMMKQSDALLAGGFSGHIFFKERWYGFDDAVYAAARLVEVLSLEGLSSAEVFAQIPEDVSTAELVAETPQGVNDKLMQMFSKRAKIADAKLVTVDGVRAEFEDGWGLVRSSKTSSALKFRFEAADDAALTRIQVIFRKQVKAIAPDVELPF
jgi:phosphomannomutase/phosphoglucomutase